MHQLHTNRLLTSRYPQLLPHSVDSFLLLTMVGRICFQMPGTHLSGRVVRTRPRRVQTKGRRMPMDCRQPSNQAPLDNPEGEPDRVPFMIWSTCGVAQRITSMQSK